MSPGYQALEGVIWRPLTAADAQAVCELEAAGEAFEDGDVEIALADVEADWRRPGFDAATMSIGAFLGSRLIAYAQVMQGRAEALVHPECRGRGLGTRLAMWTWEVARAEGRDRVGQTISDNERSAAGLFRSLGYVPGFTAWILRIDLSDPRGAPVLPEGYLFRPYRPGEDDWEIYRLIDEAFDEWRNEDSESMGFENWAASTLHSVAPEWVVLIVDSGGRSVGVAVALDYGPDDEGWIEQVAVHRDHGGRGLGAALLEESFRRFRESGRTRAGVSTDSRTGALGLYQHVGMVIARSYTRWVKTGLRSQP
jgi:ribosomal protein S18 acetylase RimI-like enzyme